MNIKQFLSWIIWLQVTSFVKQTSSEFSFSSQHAFDLMVSSKYPTSGDEVNLRCRRRREVNTVTVGTSLLGPEDNVITWEENDRSVLTTNVNDRGGCTVIIDSRFTASSNFEPGRNRLSETSCEYDGSDETVKLKVNNWTPSHLGGDRWKCLQFPFAESKTIEIFSYVPVTSVSIQQDIDRFNNPSRGTIVTCISSPSRPAPNVAWFIRNEDGTETKVTVQADLKENVERDFNGLSVTTSSVLFSQDDDHGINVLCKTSNKRRTKPVLSDLLSVIITYSPSVEIHAEPGASVLEGTDVSLHCVALGRPTPTIKWIHKGDESVSTEENNDDFMIISLDTTLFLQTVTVRDSGKYECIASNGIGDDVSTPIFLFVRENPSSSSDDDSARDDASSQADQDNDDDNKSSVSDSYTGAIVGTVTTIIVVALVLSIIVYLFVRRRWNGKHRNIIVDHRPRHSMSSNNDGSAIYATCSSGNSELPPYVDVLPPAYRLSNIANPGYEMVDNVIDCIHPSTSPRTNGKRPLPSTPPPNSDYGYTEINEGVEDMEDRGYLNTLSHRTLSSNGINNNNNNNSSSYINYDNSNQNSYINSGGSSNRNNNNKSSSSGVNDRGSITGNSNSNENNIDNCNNNNNRQSYISGKIGDQNSAKHNTNNPYITTISTGNGGNGEACGEVRMSFGGGGGSGDCDVDIDGNGGGSDNDCDGALTDDTGFSNSDRNNSNNSDTLQIRSLRQEYGGYEVPVLPPLE